jgi:hypothetical protein
MVRTIITPEQTETDTSVCSANICWPKAGGFGYPVDEIIEYSEIIKEQFKSGSSNADLIKGLLTDEQADKYYQACKEQN